MIELIHLFESRPANLRRLARSLGIQEPEAMSHERLARLVFIVSRRP